LFDFQSDRQFANNTSVTTVATRQANQSLETRQRDIYDSHRHRTFALAYYMTGNELAAEQILASTFVRAFGAAEEPTGQEVDSALVEELRERSCLDSAAPPHFSPIPSAESGARLAEQNVKRTDLEEAVQGLPAVERILFLLRDVEGYTPETIGQLLEMPESQVRRGLFAARLRLRGILAEAQAGREEKAA
jgi:RNA polymerase sigma-70 factor, ECF subfamily